MGHQFLLDLRKENLLGTIPDACFLCSNLENKGIDSRRSNHLKFLSYMKQLDSIRGTNFLETFPKYA